MSEHPVVACYRGPDSADAVGLGALLAGALGEPLVLASAYRYEPVALSAAQPAADNGRRAGAARKALLRGRAFAGAGVEVREEIVPATDVGDALVALARDVDACLLVLGRDTQAHVTRSLLPRAPCPVAVAPLSVPLPRADRPERIGVAYDGSPTAQRALVAATRLALQTGARLVLLAVGPTPAHAATWLQVAQISLGRSVDHETHALVGDPAAALTAAAVDLDLLVCGTRGRGRPLAAILGSVSSHLAAHAECPVIVVPPGVSGSDDAPLGVSSAGQDRRARDGATRG